jgi:membrane protein required for colicin V production
MTVADWIIVLVILVSTVQAAASGFFQEAFGIAGLIFGYLIAAWQYHRLGGWLGNYLKSPELADSAAFLTIFLLVMVLAGIAGRVARWSVKKTGLNFVDRLLGGVLGFARGCLMVAVVLMSITAFTPAARWLAGSELAPYFLVVGRAAIWLAPSDLRVRFYQGLDFLHRSGQTTGGR